MRRKSFLPCTGALLASAVAAALAPAYAAAPFGHVAYQRSQAFTAPTSQKSRLHGQKSGAAAERASVQGTPSAKKTRPRKQANESGQAAHPKQLSAVQVVGTIGSLMRAATTKRADIGIVDSISAETAGQFPDQTIAGALQRVPGVSVQYSADGEPNQITVRGFGPSFVNVLLNGHPVANTSFATNSFNLDVLPVQILKKAVVYKTSQAFLPVGGIGGTVNIVTWKPLEFNGFHGNIRLGGMYASLPGSATNSHVKPRLSAIIGDTTKDHRFGWLLSAVYNKRQDQYTDMNFDGGWFSTIAPLVSDTKSFFIPSDAQGEYTFQTRTRKSADLALEAKPTNRLTLNGNFLVTKYTGTDDSFINDYFSESSVINSVTPDQNGTALSYTTNTTPGVQNVFKPSVDRLNNKIMSGYVSVDYRLGGGNNIHFNSATSNASNKVPYNFDGVAGYLTNVDSPVVFHNPGTGPAFPYLTGGFGSTDLGNLRTHFPEPGGSSSSDHIFSNKLAFEHNFENGVISSFRVGLSSTKQTAITAATALPDNGNLLVPYFDNFNALVPASAVDGRIVTFPNFGGPFGRNWPKSFVTYSPQKMLAFLQTPAAYDQLSPALRSQYLATLARLGGLIWSLSLRRLVGCTKLIIARMD